MNSSTLISETRTRHSETRAELMEVITKCLHSYAISEEHWNDDLTTAFLETLRTPLGGPLAGLRLCDIPRGHRLDELQFDFPVAGGHRFENAQSTAPLSMAAITDSLSLRYTDGDDEIMRKAYACRSADNFLGYRKIAGFMTGLIDVVFKAPTPEGEKWFVADYRVTASILKVAPYPAAHFGLEYMRYEMEHHHTTCSTISTLWPCIVTCATACPLQLYRQRLWRRLLPLYSRHDRCTDSGCRPGRSWRPREWLLL